MARIYDSADYEREFGLSRSAAKVYKYLCRLIYMSRQGGKYRDRDGYFAYVKRATIAEHIGRSESTAARALAELKKAGLIRVKRTKKFARIYLCSTVGRVVCAAVNDTSTNGKNDTSNNKGKNLNNIADISILLHKTGESTVTGLCDGLLNSASATAEGQRQQPPRDTQRPAAAEARKKDRTKGRATPKQRQRVTKAEKEAARQQYKRHLEARLGLDKLEWCAFPEEWERLNALADMIADAVSVKSRHIKVNGCLLTVEQYWSMVRNIEYSESIQGLFDRIKAAEVCTRVTNLRAYTLAAVYNAVQWDSVMRGAEVSTEALYRHMA